ncbi:MAG: rod shape-determining protein MreC [Longimicrobiaceae bacterium]
MALNRYGPYLGEGGELGRKRDRRVAAVFVVAALVLLLLPDRYRQAVAAPIRATVLRPVLALQGGEMNYPLPSAETARLRAERDSLAAILVGSATLKAENDQLRALLGIHERVPRGFVPAEVVRLRGNRFEGTFLLTAGRADGVRPGSPVVAAGGLVGMVRNVDDRRSLGIDWRHPDFGVSAMTSDGETYGIVVPRSRAGEGDMLALTGVAYHSRVDSGTVVVTAGLGGIYPRGIPIGQVVAANQDEADWRRSYILSPLVGPGEMAHVLVLGPEQEGESARDLTLAWGIRSRPAEAPDTAAALLRRPGQPFPATPTAPGEAGPEPETEPEEPEPPPPPPEEEGPPLLGVPVEPGRR